VVLRRGGVPLPFETSAMMLRRRVSMETRGGVSTPTGSPQLDSRLLADAALALTLLVLSVTKAPITDAVKAAARVNRDQGGGK